MEYRCRIQSFANGGGWQRYFYRNRGSGLDFSDQADPENRHKGEAIAYSLILGGAMGNLIDRSFAAMLWIPLISIGETGIGRPSTWLILQLSSVPYFSFPAACWVKSKHQCRVGWI